jgi:hypothetical protein
VTSLRLCQTQWIVKCVVDVVFRTRGLLLDLDQHPLIVLGMLAIVLVHHQDIDYPPRPAVITNLPQGRVQTVGEVDQRLGQGVLFFIGDKVDPLDASNGHATTLRGSPGGALHQGRAQEGDTITLVRDLLLEIEIVVLVPGFESL